MVEFLEFMHTNLWTYSGTLVYTIVVGWLLVSLVSSLKGLVNIYRFNKPVEDEECTKNET